MLSNTRPGVEDNDKDKNENKNENKKDKEDKKDKNGGAKGAPTIIKDNLFSETKFKEWYQTNLRELAIKN